MSPKSSPEKSTMFHGVGPILNVMVVLSCYIILVGSPDGWQTLFSMSHGLIMAIFAGISASVVFFRLAQMHPLRMPFSHVGHDPVTYEVLDLVPAAAITILLFTLVRVVFSLLCPEGINFSITFISDLFQNQYSDLLVGILYTTLSQLFWFFGIHGPNVLFPIEQSTLHVAMLENVQTAIGSQPPYIVTKGFLDVFAYMGGSGCTLCLILAVLYKSRDPGNRRLCYLALVPALCNVNEPLLFGIPLVFNPLYIIPFLLTPLLQILVAYIATALDLVPRITTFTHWTTPALLSGYIATHSLAGTMMQVVNIFIGVLIYQPFVLFADKVRSKKLKKVLETLNAYSEDKTIASSDKKCLNRPGIEGDLAHALAKDLAIAVIRSLNSVLPPSVTQSLNTNFTLQNYALNTPKRTTGSPSASILKELYSNIFHPRHTRHDSGRLFLLFEPQISTSSNKVVGVNCLLRWNHPVYGLVSPKVIESLAEEKGITNALSSFIFRSVCAQYAQWHGNVCQNFIMSVNLSAGQLNNPNMVVEIAQILELTGTPVRNLEIEIAESLILKYNNNTYSILHDLRSHGIKIAISDFDMNYALFHYIEKFAVHTVRINHSLSIVTGGCINEHFVRSIMDISQNLQIRTLVENVITHEQCLDFKKFGCSLFQGEAFSPPLPPGDCLKYINDYPLRTADNGRR